MLTRLREIVEKVASAPRLNEALNILVTDICLAMDTEVCSVYLADHDRRCYYLMATRGVKKPLKKPRGRTVALAFDEGIVGLVGRLAEPINLADAQKHPSFKYIPSVKEERFRAFLGVPIIQRRQLLGVLVVQQRELRQYDESEESFLVTLATQMAAILSQWRTNSDDTANALPPARKKRRRPFSICTHTCFQTPDCVANSSPRSTKALLRSGPLKKSSKNLPSNLRR